MNFTNYEEWLKQVHVKIKQDPIWEFITYRKALFLADLAWFDSDKLAKDQRGRQIAWQLVRSAGSVAANIEEGFGRGFGKDYARFLRIALGSARESKGWYFRGRHVLETAVLDHRLNLIEEIIRNLVITSEKQRRRE